MKLIIFFFIIILSTSIIHMNSSEEKNMNKVEETANQNVAGNWFEDNLDMHIPQEYVAFNQDKYKFSLRESAKDTLGFEYWLGNFKIVEMINHKEFTTIDLSTELHNRFMYITSDFFVITSYMDPEEDTGLTYGSSLVYVPEKNELRELDSIIVYGINNNKLIGVREHYELDQPQFVENGYYDITNEKFTVKY